MSETSQRYILNPKTNRYIVHGGTLHRRMIKEGHMPQEAFTSRTPIKTVGKKATDPNDGRRKKVEKVEKNDKVENPAIHEDAVLNYIKDNLKNTEFAGKMLQHLKNAGTN